MGDPGEGAGDPWRGSANERRGQTHGCLPGDIQVTKRKAVLSVSVLRTLCTSPCPGRIKLEPGGKGGLGNVDSRAGGGLEEEGGAEDL